MSSITSKKQQKQITYEELMNSHFMKFPTHSKVVHTIFSPWVVCLIIIVVVGTTTYLIDGGIDMAIMTALVAGAYVPMKIAIATMDMDGHGVGLIKKGKISLLGLPTVASVMYFILFAIVTAIIFVAFTDSSGVHFGRVQIFGIAMMCSLIMSLLSWRFHTYYETWYGSEYAARMQFKSKGYSDKVIEDKIRLLKKRNILRP